MADLDQLAYSTPDAANLLGVSIQTVYRMLAAGELRTIKIRGRRLVPASELQRIVSQKQKRRPVIAT